MSTTADGARSPATDFSVVLLQEFARAGVTDVVVSPGSRSQALALAAAAIERAGGITVHVRLDERTAGFLALGLAIETSRPAAVITTSGTAVANLHPAVLEAHHSGVPMIVLSADRPAELRRIGSNQTTVQPGLFGPAVDFVRDIPAPTTETAGDNLRATTRRLVRETVASAAGHNGQPGPVQLNLAFREPLSAGVTPESVTEVPDDEVDFAYALRRQGTALPTAEIAPGPATVVIAGHDAGVEAVRVAEELGAPLIAEVSSGARYGRNVIVAYRKLLRDADFGGAVRRAIVFGHPTLSREVPALLRRAEVEAIVVRAPGSDVYDPRRGSGDATTHVVASVHVTAASTAAHYRSWRDRWLMASAAIVDGRRTAEHADEPADRSAPGRQEGASSLGIPVNRRSLTAAVWNATGPTDRLMFGASELIRVADDHLPGRKIRVHANRGLGGIDGTVSTALGIAARAERSPNDGGTTRVLIGDLTFLHDLGALVTGTHEQPPRLHVVVGNDNGGAIFRHLEVAATTQPEDMTRMMTTPQHVDIERVATGLGWGYLRATTEASLQQALADPSERLIIEVHIAD
jgi:2-succinyl-5-enolpyruvyl-6-hydroxy-3-cyclohexene-1-carboxylate synthase